MGFLEKVEAKTELFREIVLDFDLRGEV